MVLYATLLDKAQRHFGVSGSDFEKDLVVAIRQVLRDLKRDCFLSALTPSTYAGEDISLADDDYGPALEQGVLFFLQQDSRYVRRPEFEYEKNYHKALADGQYEATKALDGGYQASAWGA
jgi:hypothetical protein